MRFPPGFLWGASTSAYQIEGGNRASAFWDWEAAKGWERSGKAADSWRLWREDIECLKRLNLNAYRFSVEWSRVQPAKGEVREDVLSRYSDIASALRKAGIRPIVCLHHFSEPAWLFRELPEGWLNPLAVDFFAAFVDRTSEALKADVQDWLTFNEPMVWLLCGYGVGRFPPGRRSLLRLERTFLRGGLLANVAAAHGEACKSILRARADARVGIAQNIAELEPARPSFDDLHALKDWDFFMHRRFLDMAAEAGELDFIGVNYYTRVHVRRSGWPFVPLKLVPGYAEVESAFGSPFFKLLGGARGDRPRTDLGWEIVPEGLGRVVKRFWEAYKRPILVTENGVADASGEGRERFIREHLASLHGAMQEGAQVTGYLHWTLMDNYEWGSFKPKFGLYHVDRERDFARSPARGAAFYAEVARTGEL